MRRRHLFEFNDSAWFPRMLREYETDYLEALFRVSRVYRATLPILSDLLRRSDWRVLDLCSGGGGPWPTLLPELEAEFEGLELTLSDKFPNRSAVARLSESASSGTDVRYLADSVDIFAEGRAPFGMRTLFDALHHFRPDQVTQILEVARRDNAIFASFDAASRRWRYVAGAVFIPVLVWLLTPAVRPLRFSRLLFTYLIPILPVVIAWDGLVSHLRAHTVEELESLLVPLQGGAYVWQVEEIESGGLCITALIGRPADETATASARQADAAV